MVTFAVSEPRDLTVSAIAAHHLTAGEPVRCYRGANGQPRARRVVTGEKATGEAAHDAGPGTPVLVIVLKRKDAE